MNEHSLAYSEQEIDSGQATNADQVAAARIDLEVVDSLLHPQAILIRKALTRQGRTDLDLILIDEEENIIQALKAGVEILSLYYSGASISAVLLRKLPPAVKVYEIARRTCKKLFENEKTSRVFAIARTPAKSSLERLLETPRDLVALEDLTISGNIGAIIRASLAFGAGALILLNTEPGDIYDRRLIRASRGHVFGLPILTATREEFLHFCEESRIPILVMAAQADQVEDEAAALPERLVIALGSEKYGCSESLMNAATLRVRIPTSSRVESLNVSMAAGIMLYNRLWFNHPPARKGFDL